MPLIRATLSSVIWPLFSKNSQRSAAPILCGAGCAVVSVCPRVEGGRAPTGAGAERRTRGPPCGRADPWIARDHRPMTLAGAPLGAPPRHFWRSLLRRSSGSRFREPAFAPTRPAGSLQSGHSAARPGPGAARVRGYEPRPQGPPPAPSAERLRKTPLSERGGGNMYIFL